MIAKTTIKAIKIIITINNIEIIYMLINKGYKSYIIVNKEFIKRNRILIFLIKLIEIIKVLKEIEIIKIKEIV